MNGYGYLVPANTKKSLLNTISVLLKKFAKRLENIDSKLNECKNMDTYRLYGELITSNLFQYPPI